MDSAQPGLWSRIEHVDLHNFDFSTRTSRKQLNIPAPKCTVCGDLNFRPAPGDEDSINRAFQRDVKPQELAFAANTGCEACQLLRLSAFRWLKDGRDATTKALAGIKSLKLHSGSPGEPLIVWIDFKGARRVEYLEFYTPEGSTPRWPLVGNARTVSIDSSSLECLAVAKNWLDDCRDNHLNCKRGSSNSKLPTRVLRITSNDVCLLETTTEHGSYATLSHCWGNMTTSTHYRTTTKATIEEKKAGILLHELPKTFRDAIAICRALSIPYIWIDSLCIIQDSPDDWEREAARMADVYQNSIVTIAADGAEDGHGGCFVGKDREHRELCFKYAKSKISPSTSVKVREQRIRGRWDEVAHYKRLHPRSKLGTRAWVLQERLMPIRILHFASAEMAWECATEVRCECKLKSTPVSHGTFTNSLISSRHPLPRLKKDDTLANWYKVVEEFSSRRLTYESDRLTALSGIVTLVQRQTGRSFMCGLWEEEVALGMMWSTKELNYRGELYPCRRQEKNIAPSWSWASVTGLIQYDDCAKDPRENQTRNIVFGRNVRLAITFTASLESGLVALACLEAEAFVVPVRLFKLEGSKEYLAISERNVEGYHRTDYRTVPLRPHHRHLEDVMTFQPLAQDDKDVRWKTNTQFKQPKRFFVTSEENMMAYFNSILKIGGAGRAKRVLTPGERPYARVDVDVKEGEGTELHLEQQYLVVLLGFTTQYIDDEVGDQVHTQAVVIGRDGDDLGTWKRIGKLRSDHYGWSHWSNVSSPFKFRWV